MRRVRRFGRVGLTISLCAVFLAVSLIPDLVSPRPAYAAGNGGPPLPAPEDPLGQRAEQQVPEISINVDVRDGHLTVRAVDIWGPGRLPRVVRSYTNTDLTPTGGPGNWQFNQHLDVLPVWDEGGTFNSLRVREPDGNRGVYKFSHQIGSGFTRTNVYVKDVGTYSTLEAPMNCESLGEPPWWACSWAGTYYMVYLPKGVTRKFNKNAGQAGMMGFTRAMIVEERDANNNVTTFGWTTFPDGGTRAYISTVTDPVGHQTTYGYERATNECTERGEQGIPICVWSYRVRTATDYGRTATYTYDGYSQIISVVNAAGFTTQHGYQLGGYLNSITNARGYTNSLEWIGSGPRVSRVTAPDGTATNYTYVISGNTVTSSTVTNARGYATTYSMYAGGDPNYAGNLERVTDPLGNITQYAYDARHNVTQVTDARGNRTTYAYNSRNKVTQVVQAAGTLNLTTTLSWDGNDNLLSVTNPRGFRTDHTYNGTHNLTSVRKAAGTSDEALTQYTYTSWGGVASMIDPRSYATSYTYASTRQLLSIIPPVGGTTSFTYNGVDDQVTMTNGNGRTWVTAYDARRLVTSVTDPLNYQVRHEYDANGNRTRTYDARNYPTTFAYDNRDRVTSITDAANGVTSYLYDGVGSLTRTTNARNFSTNFTYDAANRLTQVRDALNQLTTYGYDQVGNKTSTTDRKGQLFSVTYDQANRVTQISGGGLTISHGYDANGNRLTLGDATGITGYQYDSLDRLTRTTYPNSLTVQATYDRVGNRTNLTNPGGATMAAVYDAANRLTQLTQGSLTWTFTYDGAGNRTQLNHPNGTRIQYGYLVNNWLSTLWHVDPSNGTMQSFTYTYDANGNRISQVDSPSGTTTFTYDPLNRLTQAAYPGTYGTWSWTYDPVGNRSSQSAPSGTTNYTYDANNRFTTAGGVTYSYDANGNLTAISTGRTFAYDSLDRLTQTTGSGSTVNYIYNGDGLKVRRAGPDGVTRYYYDGIRPIWETDDAQTMTAQLDRDIFGNLLSRREASGARRYIHHDGLGGTTLVTNESGASVASMLYDAWGQVRSNSGGAHGKYRFTGAELDLTTGLYHMGARFYDPAIGRWLKEDSVQERHFEPASLNFYAYVLNNPLLYVDLDGNQEKGTSAAERLQEFINARLDLERLIENIMGRGFTLKDLFSLLERNLSKISGAIGIAAAVVALASIGVVAGIIVGGAATAIAVSGVILAGLGVAVAFAQVMTGQLSWSGFASTSALNVLSALPALSAGKIAQLTSSGKMLTTLEQLRVAGWAIVRGFTMGVWASSF
jgi:RHS repeat-associated protein